MFSAYCIKSLIFVLCEKYKAVCSYTIQHSTQPSVHDIFFTDVKFKFPQDVKSPNDTFPFSPSQISHLYVSLSAHTCIIMDVNIKACIMPKHMDVFLTLNPANLRDVMAGFWQLYSAFWQLYSAFWFLIIISRFFTIISRFLATIYSLYPSTWRLYPGSSN